MAIFHFFVVNYFQKRKKNRTVNTHHGSAIVFYSNVFEEEAENITIQRIGSCMASLLSSLFRGIAGTFMFYVLSEKHPPVTAVTEVVKE